MLIRNVALPLGFERDDVIRAIARKCGKKPSGFRFMRLSVDARRGEVKWVATLDAAFGGAPLSPLPRLDVPRATKEKSVVVVGAGPCGLFAALTLAKGGLRPIVLERGADVDSRVAAIERFQAGEGLDPRTNIQFGEGGAGTFSDGKLTTGIHDPLCREVLAELVDCGAPEEILYLGKPHIGTDKLREVLKTMRRKIIRYGGQFHFETKVEELDIQNGKIRGVVADTRYAADSVILAVGHSARDTFEMLRATGMTLAQKAFSVGARIEHPRALIDEAQYGKAAALLGAADYKLSHHTADGRGVYTFCMCPGGEVVAAASELGGVVTNGMSRHARDGRNSNAALLVGVTPADYDKGDVLDGMRFQRELEQRAFAAGGGNYFAPAQTVGDFLARRASTKFGTVRPTYLPGVTPSAMDDILPAFVCAAMREALPIFDKKLRGFALPDAVLTGVETRSSSPIRMVRDDLLQSSIQGLYPAGEGAGYAGGIVSAAVDGIKTALKILK